MNKLQKELIKKVIIFSASVAMCFVFLYLLFTNEIFSLIVAIILILLMVGGLLYSITSMLIKDYKIRGILTKEEYELYTYCDDHYYIFTTDTEQEEYNRISKLIENI